ncbi:MAG: VanZ family protein [Clostridia bacterium]|nr:VanZ family protein [Clostridia bacterium]
MNRTRIWWYRGVLLVLMAAVMAFILVQSGKNGDASEGISLSVTRFLVRLTHPHLEDAAPADFAAVVDAWHGAVRKLAHMAEFGALCFLATLFLFTYPLRRWAAGLCALGYSAVFAACDELHQLTVPGRGASVRDVLIDTAGAALGLALAALLLWLVQKIRRRQAQADGAEKTPRA